MSSADLPEQPRFNTPNEIEKLMAQTRRQLAIIRQFPENGLKLLLENAANVRDLLALADSPERDLIDFDKLTQERTTFVSRDYRHVEADLVLRAPVLRQFRSHAGRMVWIYLLLEHQSEPDEWLTLRLLDYQVQIYKAQLRAWKRKHGTPVGFRLQPVVPMVLYTGTRDWEGLRQLWETMELGEQFAERTPTWKPIFLNVGDIPRKRLEDVGAAFGWVLQLLHQRRSGREEFHELLQRTIDRIETLLLPAERERLRELFSYIVALVYNERTLAEAAALQRVVEEAVESEQFRQEVQVMGKTAAQELREKGHKEGRKKGREEGKREEALHSRQAMLLLLLAEFNEELSPEIRAIVTSCKSLDQLDKWLRRIVGARRIQDVGIEAMAEDQGD
jgi:predicted transposase YdaD